MTSIAFIIDFITYLSVFCFVFHLKLKKSVLHISLGCVWAVLGSCFLYLYSPDFSYRIIILFGLYLLFQAKLDHVLVCFSLYTLISYLAECYGIYFYSLLTGTNVLDNPLILSLCRIFVSLIFLLLCITFYRGTVTIFPFSQLSAKNNLFISGLCFLHLGLMGMLNAFFNYDMSTVGRRLMVILTLILLLMFSTIFYLYLKLKKSKEKLEENSRLQQYQWELEKQHYLDLQKKDQALRKFRHDYKHHILAMQELAARKDYGELLTYLNDLSHIQSQTASISTNNPVADAIFNYFDSITCSHRILRGRQIPAPLFCVRDTSVHSSIQSADKRNGSCGKMPVFRPQTGFRQPFLPGRKTDHPGNQHLFRLCETTGSIFHNKKRFPKPWFGNPKHAGCGQSV